MSLSGVRIASIGWERPQFVIRLRDGDGGDGRAEASTFALVRADRPTAVMPPTGWRRDADTGELVLRFNVVVGPGVRPLEPGRWLLVRRDPASGDTAVTAPDPADLAVAARAFAIPRGTYRMTPAAGPSTGGLALDVALDTSDRGPGHAARVAGALRSAGWTVVFGAMKLVARRSGRRVLFVTGNQGGLPGNLMLVHDRMVERGLDRAWQIRTMIRRRGAEGGLREHVAMRWALARADVILIDGSRVHIVYAVHLDPDVRLIQLWHASGAFKTVHYSRLGLAHGPDPWSVKHRAYTHVTVSSEKDAPFYAEAFGIPEERVVATGIPRMDRYFDEARRAAGRAEAAAAYPETDGRFTILFAPTYRDTDDPTGGDYPIDIIDYAALHALCVERDAVVIIRMHPFARQDLRIPEAFADRLLDGFRSRINVNDLLFAVDLLVTDYSSIVFEYSTLGRPMLFFAYDLDEYVATRDLYVPFESFVPGKIVRTFPELLDAIRRGDYESDKVAAFADTHFAYHDSGSTDRVIDQLVLGR